MHKTHKITSWQILYKKKIQIILTMSKVHSSTALVNYHASKEVSVCIHHSVEHVEDL